MDVSFICSLRLVDVKHFTRVICLLSGAASFFSFILELIWLSYNVFRSLKVENDVFLRRIPNAIERSSIFHAPRYKSTGSLFLFDKKED